MILIPCPWCGPRTAQEFRYVGEQTARPEGHEVTPAQWRAYLYERRNSAGWTTETWFHRAGCRRFFSVERHTVSNTIRATHRPGVSP